VLRVFGTPFPVLGWPHNGLKGISWDYKGCAVGRKILNLVRSNNSAAQVRSDAGSMTGASAVT